MILSFDVYTSFGMAGVLRFHRPNENYKAMDGFFWQLTWVEWMKIVTMKDLSPGYVKINVAEFLRCS